MTGNIQWLIENGGPTIKLNLINEGLIDKNACDVGNLFDELLQIKKVKTAFTYFDKFKDYKSWSDRELVGFIHNCYEDCYERFMPFLIGLGFRKGMPVFDEKVKYMFDVYRNSGSLIIIMYLIEAGYYHEDMLDYVRVAIDKICKTAEHQCFDIYETDPSKIRWSKLPKIWKDKPICKDIHVHDVEVSELPVPTIYHIKTMILIYKYVGDKNIKKKIDTIIKYIMHPEYQKLRGFNGYSWFYNKAYYAPSPGICLPLYEDKTIEGYTGTLEMMSHIPFVTNTKWFRNCIELLEQYKTEKGTYIFPDGLLTHITYNTPARISSLYEAFISKDILPSIKKNKCKKLIYELYSTFFMAMLKNRLK